MSSVRKEKIVYLDLFRCLSILAVILIHATSQPIAKLPVESNSYFLYFVMNSGSQFAVPSFLFLSAVVLFYNYEHRWSGTEWLRFFQKRLIYIVIPYLIWSLFYFLVVRYFNHQPIFGDWESFGRKLIRGNNYAHLYFIIVIVQFYVLFPFLMTLLKWFPAFKKHLLWIGVVLQVVYFYWNKNVLHVSSPGSVFMTYMLFYFLGAYIGLHYKQIIDKAASRSWLWFGLWAVSFAAYIGKGWMRLTHTGWQQKWIIEINFITYYAYVSLTCLAILLLTRIVDRKTGKTFSVRTLYAWGAASFGIYFIHPAVLLVWRKAIQVGQPMLYHLSIIGGFTAALLISWFAYLVIARWKHAWLFVGK